MKQTNFHSMKLKIKRTALLAVGLTLFQILAWAGPRSFQQAQAIAERQAALQGIVMDQQQVSKARKQYQQEGSSSSETATSYYVFDNGADKGFTIVSGDDELPENRLTDITATALSSSVLRRITESRMSRW